MEFLEFEAPIAELQSKIKSLRQLDSNSGVNIHEEVQKLEHKLDRMTEKLFSNLSDWQITQVARHPSRPYTLDYIDLIFDDFHELHGDRHYNDDPAIVCGIGKLNGKPVAIIGHQKGREVDEKVKRNFGMPKPEGYRKALRIMELAERFSMPICTFIDTPGAYPGIGAEQRGQSEAIATNLAKLSQMQTPIINCVIGEGGSGGALAIGVGDHLMMLEYSVYSVISPEGCASILWRTADLASTAAEAMHLTAEKLHKLGLIDEIIKEPTGGAHRNVARTAERIKASLDTQLKKLTKMSKEELLDRRLERIRRFGVSES